MVGTGKHGGTEQFIAHEALQALTQTQALLVQKST